MEMSESHGVLDGISYSTVKENADNPELLKTLHKIVLLGSCSLTALTFARSCRRHGILPYLMEVTDRPSQWRLFSSALAGGTSISKEMLGTPAGAEAIASYARTVGALALVPDTTVDAKQVIGYRSILAPDCDLIAPSAEAISIEEDKLRQIRLAREVGFRVLPTWVLRAPADAASVPADAFPICVRPSDVRIRPRFKVLLIRHRSELKALLDRTQFCESVILAQRFLNAPNFMMHGVRSRTGKMIAERGFWSSRKFKGVTLTLKQADLPRGVRDASRKFVERCGLVGNYHFDLIWPDYSEVYYLEINARAGGTTDKVTRLGFDEPMLTLAAYGYRPPLEIAPPRIPHGRSVVNKRVVIQHMIAAATGGLTDLDYPGGSRFHQFALSCRDLLFAKASIFEWNDLRGALWYHCRLPRT